MNIVQEFETQIQMLLDKQYPGLAGRTEQEFLDLLTPLRSLLPRIEPSKIDVEQGHLPFVIVVTSTFIPAEQRMAVTEKTGKSGITKLFPLQPADFHTIEEVTLPEQSVYLLVDVDRGKESINKPPSEAMKEIVAAGRSPLTIDEGIALVTHYPDFLMKNNCFSLLASRHTGDQRVPAIWINGSQQPNLGWCWNGNPHTWLGSASCRERLG